MADRIFISRRERNYYLSLFKIEEDILKLALPKKFKEKELLKRQYELYKGNFYGRFCNSIMEGLTINLTNKYPKNNLRFFESRIIVLITCLNGCFNENIAV